MRLGRGCFVASEVTVVGSVQGPREIDSLG